MCESFDDNMMMERVCVGKESSWEACSAKQIN